MDLYLFVLIVLFVFAVSYLIVGVSNDAVNFLNSAIGSKVAPRNVVLIVASLGILAGTTFSSGLMEVARKGIFNPDQFILPEIMVIFIAVMITNVVLLDLFNTFALPTSTTVSIVFALLGAAVSVATIKLSDNAESISELGTYINNDSAFVIIFGILLSVVIAFSAGAIFQFITRMIFTFDYEKRMKRYGALWGGVALTAITYFILIKGAKGSSIISADSQNWIKTHTELILLYNFIFWAVVLQITLLFTKINILKPIVLIGTFALALAFASNDLVNFIGVPLAGLSTYQIGLESANPLHQTMEALKAPTQTDTLLLLLAGAIMVGTLWISKKARSVTKTEVNLSRQTEGFERFESTALSRALVRMNISLLQVIKKVTPEPMQKFINGRIDSSMVQSKKKKDSPAFDLLRASGNLMVASMVISFATSLKLPLSTTYVTFMVAMGSSLSDKAWGRESAVYRITGVLTVIGGWFFTAFIAFTLAALMALIIFYWSLTAIIVLVLFAGYVVFRTHILHKNREKEEEELETAFYDGAINGLEALNNCMNDTKIYLNSVQNIMTTTYKGLKAENREVLKAAKKDTKKLKKQANVLISNIFSAVKSIPEDDVKKDRRYGKVIASIQSIYNNTKGINQNCVDHLENHHKKPTSQQLDELKKINDLLCIQMEESCNIFDNKDFSNLEKYSNSVTEFEQKLNEYDENQILRIKLGSSTTRGSLLYLGLLADNEALSNDISNLVSVCKKNYESYLKKN